MVKITSKYRIRLSKNNMNEKQYEWKTTKNTFKSENYVQVFLENECFLSKFLIQSIQKPNEN